MWIGAHIKNLFYTFIWNFCPQLIEDGYIYAGVPPLYKVTIGKEYKYIKNDEELEKFKKTIGDKKITVNRMKGLRRDVCGWNRRNINRS